MKDAVREKFLKYGKLIEPFEIDGHRFDFFGEIQVKTVHTTFFLKDYEIISYIYVLSKNVTLAKLSLFQEEFNVLKRLARKLLKTPEGHFLSTFILLLETDRGELPEKEIRELFFRKSLLFGLKGALQCAVVAVTQKGDKKVYPSEVEETIKWLYSELRVSRK
ncbi:MAG: hypothetical protein DSY35_03105 [Desulfurobacterium sp.]|nr:MAG: hypothetical protein DSY35_03105 [Desulfurobacterium sp.]